MARRSDCIFCGGETGSGEHIFLAALGGRRMNKGILCEVCNGKFSAMDQLLAEQLVHINGVLGVRHDRHDDPRPARVDSSDGPLTIDRTGRPAFASPRVVSEEMLPDGRRNVGMQFASEEQAQEWIAEQRAAGREVQLIQRGPVSERFVSEPLPIRWSFGGAEAFREIGRIALNFLAHKWPDVARTPDLRPFKDYVEGKISPPEDAPRLVWYQRDEDFELPDPAFEFGHQILLRLDAVRQQAFARVRFFATWDLCVLFGTLPVAEDRVVLFDIDPLAESAPYDLTESVVSLDACPIPAPPTTDIRSDLSEMYRTRVARLLSRIEDRQWNLGTEGLLESINATRAIDRAERELKVAELLRPYRGRVLGLARFVSDQLRRRAQDDLSRAMSRAVEMMLVPDRESPDGLGASARQALEVAAEALAAAIAGELDVRPLDNERLRLLLAGGPGAAVVGEALSVLVVTALWG